MNLKELKRQIKQLCSDHEAYGSNMTSEKLGSKLYWSGRVDGLEEALKKIISEFEAGIRKRFVDLYCKEIPDNISEDEKKQYDLQIEARLSELRKLLGDEEVSG